MAKFEFKQDALMKLLVGSFFSVEAESKEAALEQAKKYAKVNILEENPKIITFLCPIDDGGVEEDLELISPEENGGKATLETYFIDDNNDEETLIASNAQPKATELVGDIEKEDDDSASFVAALFALVGVGISTYTFLKTYGR